MRWTTARSTLSSADRAMAKSERVSSFFIRSTRIWDLGFGPWTRRRLPNPKPHSDWQRRLQRHLLMRFVIFNDNCPVLQAHVVHFSKVLRCVRVEHQESRLDFRARGEPAEGG